jgi:outer membrane protein TolC
MALVALALLAAQAGQPRAQGAELEALLRSYGFQLQTEDGRRVVDVSLQQVLKLALERNLALQSVRVGEDIAASALEAARGGFNPTLTSSAALTRSMSLTSSLAGGGARSLSLSSTYTKPTESGIEYSLTFTESAVNGLSTSGTVPDLSVNSGSTVNLSQLKGAVNIPIGQGYGKDINLIPVRRSEAGLSGSRLNTRQNELNLVQATASTYWDLVAAQENLRVQAEAVKLSEQLLADNRQRLQAGVLSPFDVQVTESQLARERERLLTARADLARIEDLARALLNLQVIDFQVRPTDKPAVRQVQLNYEELLQRVFDNSPELKLVENRLLTNGLDLESARDADRTNLDLALYYTLQGVNDSPLGGIGGFTDTPLDNYGATLTWTLPLNDVRTPETIRQRTLERQQLLLDLEGVRADLNVRLQSSIRQVNLSREQVDTAGVSRRLAEEQLRNEIERFRVGESTSFQVAQSQQDAAAAQVQEIIARLGFERNYLSLLVLSGDIYRQYGLEPAAR